MKKTNSGYKSLPRNRARNYDSERELQKDKFEARSRRGIFVGYSEISKGYRICLPEERKIEIARDIKLLDRKMTTKKGSKDNTLSPETENLENEEVEFQFKTPIMNRETEGTSRITVKDVSDRNESGEKDDNDEDQSV